jgi:hypothetical protein
VKRKRLLWAGGILAGLLIGVPVLLWSGYAVLALLRHEHFYHGMPASWWGHVTFWRGDHLDLALRLSRSRIGRVTDYLGISEPLSARDMFENPDLAPILCDFVRSGGRNRCLGVAYLSDLRLHPEVVVPELIAVLWKPQIMWDDPPRTAAIGELQSFGPEARAATPLLLDLVYKGTQKEQRAALNALANIEWYNTDLFLELLNHPDADIGEAAIRRLSEREPKAKEAIPRLVELIVRPKNDQERRLHQVAVEAVFAIDPEAARKAGVR